MLDGGLPGNLYLPLYRRWECKSVAEFFMEVANTQVSSINKYDTCLIPERSNTVIILRAAQLHTASKY